MSVEWCQKYGADAECDHTHPLHHLTWWDLSMLKLMRLDEAQRSTRGQFNVPDTPQGDLLVSCNATKSVKHFGMPQSVAQPADNSLRYAEHWLLDCQWLSLTQIFTNLPVMNLSDASRTLYSCHRGKRVGPGIPTVYGCPIARHGKEKVRAFSHQFVITWHDMGLRC